MKKLVAIFALVFLATGVSQSALSNEPDSATHTSICEPGSPITQPFSEKKYIPVGGIEQWITINGESCFNPVVLFLHGGPGNPESIYADSVYGEWEGTFTIVHWDQRAAGKTYGRNPEPEELNLELMVKDGIEVVEYLLSYLNKDRIILVGSSWGSVLGVYIIQEIPDSFYAFVSTSQAGIDTDGASSYNRTLNFARAAEDPEAISVLESMGSPPWTNPRNFGIMRRIQRAYEATVTDPWPSTWVVSSDYNSPDYRQSYTAGENFSYIQYVGINGDGFSNEINLDSLGYDFKIPVYFIQGAEDLLTTPESSKQYFDRIEAPDKDYLLLPNVGHGPNKLSHEANFQILNEKVLPLTK